VVVGGPAIKGTEGVSPTKIKELLVRRTGKEWPGGKEKYGGSGKGTA